MTRQRQRDEATIAAELAELRRHLGEAPPHHSGGRPALEDRVRRLERELAQARRKADHGPSGDPR
jgi:hypothetical protein